MWLVKALRHEYFPELHVVPFTHFQLEIWGRVQVWRQAATQVFFALGLGFGSVIAYSSYNPKNNNCHRDAFTVSTINFLTSVLATLVVFAVLGFHAKKKSLRCVERYVRISLHSILSLVYKCISLPHSSCLSMNFSLTVS